MLPAQRTSKLMMTHWADAAPSRFFLNALRKGIAAAANAGAYLFAYSADIFSSEIMFEYPDKLPKKENHHST